MSKETTNFVATPEDLPADFGECIWRPDNDGTYETSCGQAFVFTGGGPRENGARFCLYCGHPLKEAVHVES